jgi:uncharacterized membrane protein YebE (DUF533 family)
MKTPPDYEEMIQAIADTARKYGFFYQSDTLTDDCSFMERGHVFDANVHLWMAEYLPIPETNPFSEDQSGK